MSNWLDRLKDEKEELSDRLNKLSTFLDSDSYAGIDTEQQVLLAQQAFHMNEYLKVLNARIDVCIKANAYDS